VLVTPPLDGMILPGVTRDSVLSLCRQHAAGTYKVPGLGDNLVVEERPVTMKEVIQQNSQGNVIELFGTGELYLSCLNECNIDRFSWPGTAAVISPVNKIGYMGKDINLPEGEDGMGPVSRAIWSELTGIQTGAIKSDWSVVVD
jgi:branched-chain amino acid aminotransferase